MLRILGVAALAAVTGGCATLTRGTTDQVQVYSDPPGADVKTSMGFTCATPCTIQTNRKDEFTVTITKPGHEPEAVEVKTQVAGAGAAGFAGNVIIGGVIGMAADAATGATLEHVPDPVRVKLYPTGKRPPDANLPPAREAPAGAEETQGAPST